MLRLDNRRKSKEESWKEMLNLSHLGHAGHRSAVIVVFSAIIDTSVLVDNLYRRIIKYSGGCCCCWLSRQRIHRICRIRRRSVVGAVRWSITLVNLYCSYKAVGLKQISACRIYFPGKKSYECGGKTDFENYYRTDLSASI